jgi:hypothetical protein
MTRVLARPIRRPVPSEGNSRPRSSATCATPDREPTRPGAADAAQPTGRAERAAAPATIDRHDPAPSGASPWRPARPTLSLVAAGREQPRHGAGQRLRPAEPGVGAQGVERQPPASPMNRWPCTAPIAMAVVRALETEVRRREFISWSAAPAAAWPRAAHAQHRARKPQSQTHREATSRP